MGFVSLMATVYMGIMAPGETGMKPEKRPVTLGMMLWMGTQGLSKVDWTTEWF